MNDFLNIAIEEEVMALVSKMDKPTTDFNLFPNQGETKNGGNVMFNVMFRLNNESDWELEDSFETLTEAQEAMNTWTTPAILNGETRMVNGQFKIVTLTPQKENVSMMENTTYSWMDWPVAQMDKFVCIGCKHEFPLAPPFPGERRGAVQCPKCRRSCKQVDRGFRAARRFLTSTPTAKRLEKIEDYNNDLLKGKPVEILTQKYGMQTLFRNRNFRNAWLEEFIMNQGWDFNLQVFMDRGTGTKMTYTEGGVRTASSSAGIGFPTNKIKSLIMDETPGWVTAMSWSTDAATFVLELIRPDGTKATWMEFTDEIGLNVLNSAKMSKRLAEIVRETLFAKRFRDIPLYIKLTDELYNNEMHADGISTISTSFALSLCEDIPDPVVRKRQMSNIRRGKIRRVNLRVLIDGQTLFEFPEGALLKGDAIIIPDDQMILNHGAEYDIITHSVNFKPELGLKSDMGAWATMFPHHAHHPALTDTQTMSWFQGAFPIERLAADFEQMNNDVIEGLRDGSGIPAHMIVSMKDGSEGDVNNGDSLIEANNLMTRLWTACGLDINMSQFLMNWIGKGHLNMINRLRDADKHPETGRIVTPYYELRFPMRHSAYMHVITHEHLEVSGYEIPAHKRNMVFYHKPSHSLAIPGDKFIENYRRHGGWDLDDAIKASPYEIINDDGSKDLKLIGIRCPNSYGEYGIYDVDLEDFPFYFQFGDYPQINASDLPTFIEDLTVVKTIDDLPEGRDIDKGSPMTVQDAIWMVDCLALNPGVGQWVNPMIAQNAARHDLIAKGHNVSPYRTVQMADTEWFVDTLTAEFNLTSFQLILEDIESSFADLENEIGIIDRYTCRVRAGRLFGAITRGKSDMVMVSEGYFWDANQEYARLVNKYKTDLADMSLKERVTINELMNIRISASEKAYANKELFLWFGSMASKAPADSAPAYLKRRHWASMSTGVVQRIMNAKDPSGNPLRWYKVLIALYQKLHNSNFPQKDLILFQAPGSEDEISAMYLLIKVIERYAPGFVTVSPDVAAEFGDDSDVEYVAPEVPVMDLIQQYMGI